jgi:hypothetical protein
VLCGIHEDFDYGGRFRSTGLPLRSLQRCVRHRILVGNLEKSVTAAG